jgi:D-beta-D-heptose 7-phosphate kinase/D-beta-D-heptose 1-phosphate adenosyltransferase
VLVVGDVMLDRYWSGPCERVSPEAPVPVLKVEQREQRPGGAAHVALSSAALGCLVSLAGVTGVDEAAGQLGDALEAAGIINCLEQCEGLQTVTKLRVLSRHQQMIRLDFEQPLPGLDVSPWLRPGALQEFKAVVISDYGKGTLAEAASLLEAVGKSSIPLLVDPKDGDYVQWRGATLLTPNISEFEAVVGRCADESILQRKGQAMITELDLQALLVTRGERGMTLLRPGLDMLHLPARTQDVYDVTGAGDTVIAVLASALGAGNTIEQAVALANLAAGLAVGHPGTAVINGPELVDAVHAERGVECGVLGLEQLQTAVDSARKQGQRIVFTNGCFDILHAGHVACLEQARQRGDRLIVAVNSDASVLRLKGSGRPLNTLSRRMAVLAALEAVDWVISFDTDTPEELLVSLRPDLLVKGGDYRLEQVVGRKIVEAYGGEVEVLDLLPGFSTSALVDEPDA